MREVHVHGFSKKADILRRLSNEAQQRSQRLNLRLSRNRKTQIKQASLAGIQKSKAKDDFSDRPFRERKAALNLIQLAKQSLGEDTDRVSSLIQTLTV